MPTFRSIGVHPDLRKRLVVASPTAEGDETLLVPIATPHALLSRHPGGLRLADETLQSSKAIAIPQAESLRHDVANAMLVQSKTGRHWKRIANAQPTINDDDMALGPRQGKESLFPSTLELLQYHQESLIPKRVEIRIGCESLDRAIALPPEFAAYSSTNPLCAMATVSQEHLGIPFGFITQFTGPPASGKSKLARRLGLSCANQGGISWLIHSGTRPHISGSSEAMKHIFLVPAMDGFDLLARLAEFESTLLQEDMDRPALLIVDSCSVCLGAVEDESMYATVSSAIKRLTREYDVATVLVNGTVADRQLGGRKAALGQFWSGTADISVWLEAQPNRGSVKAIVQHHFAREASSAEHSFSLRATC